MLPDPENDPSHVAQLDGAREIAGLIPSDLGSPVGQVGLRQAAVVARRAAVPEAAVYEDRDLGAPKCEIRTTGKLSMNSITAHPRPAKFRAKQDLRLRVSSLDPRHVERADSSSVNVCHLLPVEHRRAVIKIR
jgi:hypothetical protein